MTEQQYRIIADRDKGDDPQWYDAEVDDRVTATVTSRYPSEPRNAEVVRIERPVPTTDCPRCEGRGGLLNTHGEDSDCPRCGGAGSMPPSVPTREQIAEVLWHVGKDTHDHRLWNRVKDMPDAEFTQHCWQNADAVLALLNGTYR